MVSINTLQYLMSSAHKSFLLKAAPKIKTFLLENNSKENSKGVILKLVSSVKEFLPELGLECIPIIINEHLL